MLQQKYYFSKKEDVRITIRFSEKEFHKCYMPLYANCLFCNSFTMNKIGNSLINNAFNEIAIYTLIDINSVVFNEKLNNGAFTWGMELTCGKIDFEASDQIAKYSQNVFISGIESFDNDDFLLFVRDDSLLDNMFVLKYIPDSGDDDDTETVYSPDEKRICTLV